MAAESKFVIYAALVGNSAIAVTKFAAAIFTGSSAMLAEGIHSVADVGNQGLLLFGLRQSNKPASEDYPFGHGKEIYFWSFVVAMMLFTVGAGFSIYEGIKHLLHPSEITSPIINYIVLSLAIVFEAGAWYFAWREFRKVKGEKGYFQAVREGKDPTLFVVLFEDSAAMAGLIVALLGVWLASMTGWPYFDGIASILIGLILAGVAIWLGVETKGLLIGEAAQSGLRQGVRDIVRHQEAVERINELSTLHMGPDSVLVTLSVDFNNELSAEQVETTVGALNHEIKQRFSEVQRVFIEVESWATHRRQADGEST